MKKVIFPLLGTNKGGNILSAISICKKINQAKFKSSILLISSSKKKNYVYYLLRKRRIDNINFITLREQKIPYLKNIKLIISLIKFFYNNKYDIVHTNDGYLNFYFSILKIIFGYKLIIHLRNTDNSRRNYISFFLANKIICISHFVKKKISNLFNQKKKVIYNYVETYENKIKLIKNHKIFIQRNINKKIILFISNLHERKKPEIFLDVLKNLSSKDKDYIGLMIIRSSKEDYLYLKNEIKKKGLNKNIYLFNNWKAHYWIPFTRKFNKKVIFAPSVDEPLGRILIEAILNNIFVVANNSGGHKEIIKKNCGILCDINSINGVARIIDKIFAQKHNKVTKTNISFIKKKFQNKNYFRNIENIYSKI